MLHNVSIRQVLLLALFTLFSSTLISQVSIKERVEIRPKSHGFEKGKQETLFSDSELGEWLVGAGPNPLYASGLDSSEIFYWPDGADISDPSVAGAQVTVSVESAGDYACLSFDDYDIIMVGDHYEFVPTSYYSGRKLTVPLFKVYEGTQALFTTFVSLLYDESKGTFNGATDTVYITVSGLGSSSTFPVVLVKVKKLCAHLSFEPVALEPGQVAKLEFKTQNGLPYAADTKFDVAIVDGGDNAGALESSSAGGSFLSKTEAPVSYIAPVAIEADSLVVQVVAYAYALVGEGGNAADLGIANSTRNGSSQQLQRLAKLAGARLTGRLAPKEKSVKIEQSKNSQIVLRKLEVTTSHLLAAGACPPAILVVKEGTKVKVTAAKATLRPFRDHDNKDNPNYNKNGPDKRREIIDWKKRESTEVTVSVTDANNDPIPNYAFTLQSFVRPNSGGHDHNDSRPTGKFITTDKDTVDTFQASTNSEGRATYTYLCSGFGGVDSILVKGRTDRDTSTTTILLQFSGLKELTPGDHYRLIGAHSQGATSEHEKNHFGTDLLVEKLKELADTAHSRDSYNLRVNDMSLMDGGPFDIWNNWDTPHQDHREGISADVSSIALNDDGTPTDITQEDLTDWLDDLAQSFTYRIENEVQSARHFHVTVK